MKKKFLDILLLSIFSLYCQDANAEISLSQDKEFQAGTYNPCGGQTFFQAELRSLPYVGFFPLGGNAKFNEAQFSSYIGGISLDFINFIQAKRFVFQQNTSIADCTPLDEVTGRRTSDNPEEIFRFTILNLSAYLIGANINDLISTKSQEKSNLIQIAYVRLGPSFKFGLLKQFAVGAQFGYAGVFNGNLQTGTTTFQHGVDISLHFTWIGKPIPIFSLDGSGELK